MGAVGYYLRKLFTIFKGEVLVLPSRVVVLLFFSVSTIITCFYPGSLSASHTDFDQHLCHLCSQNLDQHLV